MKGRRHRYHPDILVEYHDGRRFIEEVKGKVWDPMKFMMKNITAISYCSTRGLKYRVIFWEQLDRVD